VIHVPAPDQLKPQQPAAERSAVRGPLLLGGLGVAGLGLLAVRNPNVSGSYGYCPFKAITGWDCPFCGGLRGTYALVHGDVATALDHNVLLPLMLAGLVGVGWRWSRGTPVRWSGTSRTGRLWVVAAVVVLAVFWLARNLPALGYLRSSA